MLFIFDYFGVVAQDHFWYTAQAGVAAHGHSEQMRSVSLKMNVGEVSWDDYCRAVAADLAVSFDEIQKRYTEHKITPHIVELLHDIKAEGHGIVLLSNASSEYLLPIMRRLSLDKLFERTFVSSDMHFVKPDPRAYEYVLKEMNTAPSEAILIDDNAQNVDGARSCGLAGILFESTDTCRKELISSGLLAPLGP